MLNFGRNKKEETKAKKEKEQLLRKVMGKNSGRRVFGFKCNPSLPADLKLLSDKMNIPVFALAEHALELGLMDIKAATGDPEEYKELCQHIKEVHVAERTIEKIARYDEDVAADLRADMLYRFKIDKAVRQIVVGFVNRGMDPKYIPWYLDYGYRCSMAAMRNRPRPTPKDSKFTGNSATPQSENEETDADDRDSSDDHASQ